jgi:hypothetical protein
MKYTRNGENVTLEMTQEDYERLTIILGYAVGGLRATGKEAEFWEWIDFVNRLNAGNPDFTPYTIPEQAKGGAR